MRQSHSLVKHLFIQSDLSLHLSPESADDATHTDTAAAATADDDGGGGGNVVNDVDGKMWR